MEVLDCAGFFWLKNMREAKNSLRSCSRFG